MSTTATVTVTEMKLRMNEIKTLLDKLNNAIVDKGVQITLKEGDRWHYRIEGNEFEYDKNSIFQLSDRGIFAKLIDAIAVAKYYTPPDAAKIEAHYKEPGKLYMQFLSVMISIRTQELMMANYPGTYHILEYLFAKEDAEISGDVEKNLPPHMQYLYALPKLFWKKPISHFNSEVIEALEKTEGDLYRVCGIEDINDAIIEMSKDIWDTFYALYREPPENPGGGKGGGGGGGGSGGTPPKGEGRPLTDEEKEQLKKGMESGRTLQKLKEAMKDMSKDREGGEDSKESFKIDVEQEFDEKEQKEEESKGGGGSNSPGDDELLQKAMEDDRRGHGASEGNGYRVEKMPYHMLYREIYHLIPGFKKKLASIMKDNLYNRQGGSYRSGKLNTKKLYKVETGSEKVFTRKVHRSHKDYKVTILVDESGSMTCDKKNFYAALGCTLLAEVLSGAHIDFEIIGFNGEIRIYKKFGQAFGTEIRSQIENIIPNSYGSGSGCNDDGYAVNLATHRLRKNSSRTSERMLFVLSDGFPAESSRTLPRDEIERTGKETPRHFDLRTEIEQAEHDVYVFGIGINATHVAQYYDNCAVVDTVHDLPNVLLSQLKKMIRRG